MYYPIILYIFSGYIEKLRSSKRKAVEGYELLGSIVNVHNLLAISWLSDVYGYESFNIYYILKSKTPAFDRCLETLTLEVSIRAQTLLSSSHQP